MTFYKSIAVNLRYCGFGSVTYVVKIIFHAFLPSYIFNSGCILQLKRDASRDTVPEPLTSQMLSQFIVNLKNKDNLVKMCRRSSEEHNFT